jgi:hypothetical protein
MLHTSLIVELLRSQPRLMFWMATLTQGALWWLVPSLLYASPPGELPLVLAVGHEFQLGSAFGPPLAFWLAEIAFRIAGAPGVYLLAQVCVVTAYYGVFTLARAIVGVHHATLAVLLMAGIFAFAAPAPDFGPPILALPFTAFALVNLWRAVGERRHSAWFALAPPTPASSWQRRSPCSWRRRGVAGGRCGRPNRGSRASSSSPCCFPTSSGLILPATKSSNSWCRPRAAAPG